MPGRGGQRAHPLMLPAPHGASQAAAARPHDNDRPLRVRGCPFVNLHKESPPSLASKLPRARSPVSRAHATPRFDPWTATNLYRFARSCGVYRLAEREVISRKPNTTKVHACMYAMLTMIFSAPHPSQEVQRPATAEVRQAGHAEASSKRKSDLPVPRPTTAGDGNPRPRSSWGSRDDGGSSGSRGSANISQASTP